MGADINPADLLRLCTVPRIGSQRIRNLIARFKFPEQVFSAPIRQLIEVEGIDKILAANIKKGGEPDFVADQYAQLRRQNATLITYWDAAYPKLLKQITDAPLLLYLKGQVDVLQTPSLAIVGTRMPSSYGKLVAEKFARELAERQITVVSGLARGIDTVAHRSVVLAGGATVAVLGSGVDQIYPFENIKLAGQLLERGALVSEFPMGAKPDAPHFPRRNRVISGLSLATLVVEAGEKSGALITADFALEQGRDVFAVPGNINNPKSLGCNNLIQQGARIVQSIDDIIDEVGGALGRKAEKARAEITVPLSPAEEKIYQCLSDQPRHIDWIAAECQMQTSQALGILLTLELKNVVRQLIGKNFVRNLS